MEFEMTSKSRSLSWRGRLLRSGPMFRGLLPLLVGASVAFAAERKFDFSETRTGETPSGFRSALTGKGSPGDWKVITTEVPPIVAPLSPKAPVEMKRGALAQLSLEREDSRAPLLIYDADTYRDFTFSTRFKIVAGESEQMAGIAFRLQDEKNYYYVRANAKDRNVAFFRYVEGELIGPISVSAEVKTNEWIQLAIECRGSKFRALLNDRESIPWTEPNLVPFPDGSSKGVFPNGKIAFWTKSDSLVYFADARLDYAPKEAFAQTLIRETMQVNPRLIGLKIFGMTTNNTGTSIIASTDEKEIGQPGEQVERDCIEKGGSYFGKGSEVAVVTMPLHDRNGETVGAVRVVMTTFFGQMENNALARARPIVKSMTERISSAKELLQ
jgi:hypothetical protein